MAFFTRTSSSIPYLLSDHECHADSSTPKPPAKEDGGISSTKTTLSKIHFSDEVDNKSNECSSTDQYAYVVDRVLGVEV